MVPTGGRLAVVAPLLRAGSVVVRGVLDLQELAALVLEDVVAVSAVPSVHLAPGCPLQSHCCAQAPLLVEEFSISRHLPLCMLTRLKPPPPAQITFHFELGCPLQSHCCTRAPLLVEEFSTSRHLPLLALTSVFARLLADAGEAVRVTVTAEAANARPVMNEVRLRFKMKLLVKLCERGHLRPRTG